MASTLTRNRVTHIHSAESIDSAEGSRRDRARSRLIDELVVAFFVAMAVMWVVTAIAEVFA